MVDQKTGIVLLPFLDEKQLQGFYAQECVGNDFGSFYRQWTKMQSNLPTSAYTGRSCYLTPMEPEEAAIHFTNSPVFQDQYAEQQVSLCWLHHYQAIIPMKPFVAKEDCERLEQMYREQGMLAICLDKLDRKKKAQISLSNPGNNIQFSLVTEDRTVTVKGLRIQQNEQTGELRLIVQVGRPSPFIEVTKYEGRIYLVNGLHRLYALQRVGFDGPIPCVLLDHAFDSGFLSHSYGIDIYSAPRPPYLFDFLVSELTYEFDLQTGLKHIQLFSQETLIPSRLG